MNKQAFTFLTLFSLILVLSIYYIMLPPHSSKEETVNSTTNTIVQLQKALDEKRNAIITKNNDIIAKESSSADSINEALETISQTKSLSEKEQSIVTKIKALGYDEVYVEIENQTVKVTALKKDAAQSDASKIIKEVLNTVGENYQVEVKFVNE